MAGFTQALRPITERPEKGRDLTMRQFKERMLLLLDNLQQTDPRRTDLPIRTLLARLIE